MRRLVICDPACVQPFGHNVVALSYFKNAFAKYYDSTIAVSCRLQPDDSAKQFDFLPFYNFYYARYFPSVRVPPGAELDAIPTTFFGMDRIEDVATQDALRLIEQLRIGRSDTILFPHLDFYGVVGLLNALQTLPQNEHPRVLLRFIGVMENATGLYRDPTAELLTRISVALQDGLKLELSAETPRYADYLAHRLRAVVAVTGYPDDHSAIPMNRDGAFVFACPGSGRADKGFLELHSIFEAVRRRDPDLNIRFVAQLLAPHDLKHHMVPARQLYAIPGVDLLPSVLTDEQIRQVYADSHAILLPYARDIYDLRGSAALMEATALGRPALTLTGTAFAEQVQYYKLGRVVKDYGELVEAILEFGRKDRTELEFQALQARHRYRSDNHASYIEWMSLQ